MTDELEEYSCKFCDNKIIAGFRCVDCYLKKVTVKPAKPYKVDDYNHEYDPLQGPPPQAPTYDPLLDPFKNGYKLPDPLEPRLGYPYIPLTGTDKRELPPFDIQTTDTTAGSAHTYNPWFRDTWKYENNPIVTSNSTDLGVRFRTNGYDLGNSVQG